MKKALTPYWIGCNLPLMKLSNKGTSALALASRGWRVFPLTPNSKVPLKSLTDWENQASDDPIQITEWWSANPSCNIGLATGPSGLCVLDFDSAKSPQEESGIEAFKNSYPGRKLPSTYTVRTAGGGWHLYYHRSGAELRNSAGRLAPRVDTRAQGGYVVAPGSTVDGNQYEATGPFPSASIPDLPSWIVKALEDKPVMRQDIKPKGDSTAYALAALRGECEALARTGEGGRNHAANRAAWNVSRFVARGELDEAEAMEELLIACTCCGLPYREAKNALASGMSRGIKHYA